MSLLVPLAVLLGQAVTGAYAVSYTWTLTPGTSIDINNELQTFDLIRAGFSNNSDLCIFNNISQALWCAGIGNLGAVRATLETNGNFTVRDGANGVLMTSNTVNGTSLELRRLGNLQLYDISSNVIWTSHDPCQQPGSCVNGGNCTYATQLGYYCNCAADYDGDLCEATKNFTLIGCYPSNQGSTLGGHVLASVAKLTVGNCAAQCKSQGKPFAGIENMTQCYCGNDYHGTAAAASSCNMTCVQAAWQNCGGPGFSAVYPAIVCTDQPPFIDNAVMTTDANADSYIVGDDIFYNCSFGYESSASHQPSFSISCQVSGTDGIWPAITCYSCTYELKNGNQLTQNQTLCSPSVTFIAYLKNEMLIVERTSDERWGLYCVILWSLTVGPRRTG